MTASTSCRTSTRSAARHFDSTSHVPRPAFHPHAKWQLLTLDSCRYNETGTVL